MSRGNLEDLVCYLTTLKVQLNFDFMNLYITKFSLLRTILVAPVIVKYVEKNLDSTRPGPSLNRDSTVVK